MTATNRWQSSRVDTAFLLTLAAISSFAAQTISRLRSQVAEARRFGQYRLGRRIGAGGMGEVFLAEHELLKRPCAVKLIRPEVVLRAGTIERFEREVRINATLSHPNTVEIFDYGRTEDGTYYYVMEYLPGMSLADLVERHGPLPPGRVVYLLRQVALALQEAHEAGLIHRDIKPSNIFAAREARWTTWRSSSTSVWFGPWQRPPRRIPATKGRSWARRSTCRPSRRRALGRSTRGAISTRWEQLPIIF